MINVTCAIIRNEEEKVLVVQRGLLTDHPLKWEFPGGKIDPGESETECIIREIDEELSMDIVIVGRLADVIHDYGIKKIKLIPFICDTLDEKPLLTEHVDYKWLSTENLRNTDFSEADIAVAMSYLEQIKKKIPESIVIQTEPEDTSNDPELEEMVNRMISMREVNWVAASAGENPAIFNKLLEFSFSENKKLAFHSSWTLTKVCDKYPQLIVPHLGLIIESLVRLDNESTERSFLRIISLTAMENVSPKHHGILADHCFRALNSQFSDIAIKAYSMEILYNLTLLYPEFANELALSIGMLQVGGSAGILSRGRAIIRKLSDLTSG